MALSKNRFSKIVFTLLVLLTVIASAFTFIHPMALFPDPSWGFQVMQSMEHGGGFNQLVSPDQGELSRNYAEFLSWWSPGQYFLPYFFKSMFRLNIGQACAVTILFCNVAGLLGYYKFFRRAGFSMVISAVSIAFIASQLFYITPFVFYNGGEVLLFGFGGWFLYGCLALNKPNDWRMIVFVLLSGWIGFFCKSSFMWIYAAGLCFVWIKTSRGYKLFGKWIINGVWLGFPAAVSVACIYAGYLSKGRTPASGGRGLKLVWETFGFPLASPLLSGFSIDELTHGLLFHPDGPMFSYTIAVLIIVALALCSLFMVVRVAKIVPHANYTLMLLIFYAVSVLFFGSSFLRQLAISYEGRHLRMMGLLFTPGMVYLVSRLMPNYRLVFGLVWIGILAASLEFIVHGYHVNKEEEGHSVSGITQQFLDQPGLDELKHLDDTHNNAVFVFVSADLGLEVRHNRFITLEPIGPDLKINYYDYVHCGHAGPLYIFLPSAYKGPKAALIMKSFEDYKGFKLTELSDEYVMYSAE